MLTLRRDLYFVLSLLLADKNVAEVSDVVVWIKTFQCDPFIARVTVEHVTHDLPYLISPFRRIVKPAQQARCMGSGNGSNDLSYRPCPASCPSWKHRETLLIPPGMPFDR